MDFEKDEFKTPRRIIVLRAIVFLMLATAAAILASLSYMFFRSFEKSAFSQQFDSAADLMSASIQNGLNSKLYAAQGFSTLFSYRFSGPNSTWPNVTISGFEQLSASQLLLCQARAASFNPVIRQSSRRQWEVYATGHVGLLNSKSIGSSWPVSQGIGQ